MRPHDAGGRHGWLSPRQVRFVAEYVVDLNGTQAAIRAGYSRRTARIKASQLLARPEIQREVEVHLQHRAEQRRLVADAVVERLSRIALGDIRELFDDTGQVKKITELPGEAAALITSVDISRHGTTRVKLDRLRALELLMRHLALPSSAARPAPADDRAAPRRSYASLSQAELAKGNDILMEIEKLSSEFDTLMAPVAERDGAPAETHVSSSAQATDSS